MPSTKFSAFRIFAAVTAAAVFMSIFTGCSASSSDEESTADVDYRSVLESNGEFLFVEDGQTESKTVGDIPALFDPDNLYETKIWQYCTVDLDGDGTQEAVLSVYGVAGDMGGQVILHQDGDTLYGYKTDNRTLVELKADGSGTYSDPTGVAEVGICRVSEFSDTGYTLDKITYATGDYTGFDTFVVDHEEATEEEYDAATEEQSKKQDVAWVAYESEAASSPDNA